MHAIIRIDEVEKRGVVKISESKGSNVSLFPSMPRAGMQGQVDED
jgi:hypothetical protein